MCKNLLFLLLLFFAGLNCLRIDSALYLAQKRQPPRVAVQGHIPAVESRGPWREGAGGGCPPSLAKRGSSDTTGNTKAQKVLYNGL